MLHLLCCPSSSVQAVIGTNGTLFKIEKQLELVERGAVLSSPVISVAD